MTEKQAEKIIDLLDSIDSKLNPVYDVSDICSKLDDLSSDLEDMKKKLSDCVSLLGNIDTNTDK